MSEGAAENPPAAPPPPEEPKMEIHKPKPVHNWREFLAELGTIVLGIVIAIGLEQAVVWLHWQGEVKTARAALAAEFTINDGFFARRIAFAPCIDRQHDEAQAIIADLQARKPPHHFTNFNASAGAPRSDSEWQSERAAQTLTHFPREELALMSRYYAMLPDFEDWLRTEIVEEEELSILQDPPTGLELATLMQLKVNLASARNTEALIACSYAKVSARKGRRSCEHALIDGISVTCDAR